MTLSGTIKTCLYDNWGLTGALAKAKLKFADTEWYDSTDFRPQIVISPFDEPIQNMFGGTLRYSKPRFLANIWVHVPAGSKGETEKQQAEDIRYEVARLVMANRANMSPLQNIVPLSNGIPLHETEGVAVRIFRWELTLQATQSKGNT